MTTIHADQNLRLAQKMLQQQGQINALTTALAEVTHEFEPGPVPDCCHRFGWDGDSMCWGPPTWPVHQTPRAVLARPGLQ